jgi:hypothetical protein
MAKMDQRLGKEMEFWRFELWMEADDARKFGVRSSVKFWEDEAYCFTKW